MVLNITFPSHHLAFVLSFITRTPRFSSMLQAPETPNRIGYIYSSYGALNALRNTYNSGSNKIDESVLRTAQPSCTSNGW